MAKLINAKIFRNVNNQFEAICLDVNEDYRTMIKNQRKNDYFQFIITSDIMIYALKTLMLKYNFKLKDVVLMEDDDSMNKILEQIINLKVINEDNLEYLLMQLETLSDRRCIDIQNIDLSKYDKDSTILKIRANGIIQMNERKFWEWSPVLIKLLREAYLGGA